MTVLYMYILIAAAIGVAGIVLGIFFIQDPFPAALVAIGSPVAGAVILAVGITVAVKTADTVTAYDGYAVTEVRENPRDTESLIVCYADDGKEIKTDPDKTVITDGSSAVVKGKCVNRTNGAVLFNEGTTVFISTDDMPEGWPGGSNVQFKCTCSSCGSRFSEYYGIFSGDDRQPCPCCGEEDAVVYDAESAPESTCRNCEHSIEEEADACPYCGQETGVKENEEGQEPLLMNYCGVCGHKFADSEQYCPECGEERQSR